MQEKIELQPVPILNIGQIDLNTSDTKSLVSKHSKRSPNTYGNRHSTFLLNRSNSIIK